MQCPNCGSGNCQVQLVEQGQQTNKKGVGFGGHMNNAARTTTAVATFGMSNLLWKKIERYEQDQNREHDLGHLPRLRQHMENQEGRVRGRTRKHLQVRGCDSRRVGVWGYRGLDRWPAVPQVRVRRASAGRYPPARSTSRQSDSPPRWWSGFVVTDASRTGRCDARPCRRFPNRPRQVRTSPPKPVTRRSRRNPTPHTEPPPGARRDAAPQG